MSLADDDLIDLLRTLRDEDFAIGTQQYLSAHLLVAELGARESGPLEPAALRGYLGPLLCSSPAEQDQFVLIFEEWSKRFKQSTVALPDGHSDPDPVRVAAVEQLKHRGRWWLAGALGLMIAVVGVWLAVGSSSQKPAPVKETGEKPEAGLQNPGSGAAVIPKTTPYGGVGWTLAGLGGLVVLGGVQWLFWRWQARGYLERRSVQDSPRLETLYLPRRSGRGLPERVLSKVGRILKARVPMPSPELDVPRTVERMERSGGWLSPVYRQRLVQPEYLVLIDRSSCEDHFAAQAAAVVQQLREQGVPLTIFEFDGDARLCYAAQSGREMNLVQLRNHFAVHRLLVISEGAEMRQVYGGVEPWVERFREWGSPVLLTPKPFAEWGDGEASLARVFEVLPFSGAGWVALDIALRQAGAYEEEVGDPEEDDEWEEWEEEEDKVSETVGGEEAVAGAWPRELAGRPERFVTRQEPATAVIQRLLKEVKNYLGPEGWSWFCAGAVYPRLSLEMMLYLGESLKDQSGRPLLEFERLTRLARLPWMRRGDLPDWLRERLILALDPALEKEIRALLLSLLDDMTREKKPGEKDTFPEKIAPLDPMYARLLRAVAEKLGRRKGVPGPWQDAVFLRFLSPWRFRLHRLAMRVSARFVESVKAATKKLRVERRSETRSPEPTAVEAQEALPKRPAFLEEVTTMVRIIRKNSKPRLTIVTEIADSVPDIRGDIDLIVGAIDELFRNATSWVEGFTTGGTVTLGIRTIELQDYKTSWQPDLLSGEFVEIAISDTAPTIPSEELPQFFDPVDPKRDFYDDRSRPRGSTVRKKVKQLGGFVKYSSQRGDGNQFLIYLPAAAPGEAVDTKPGPWQRGVGRTLPLLFRPISPLSLFLQWMVGSSLLWLAGSALTGFSMPVGWLGLGNCLLVGVWQGVLLRRGRLTRIRVWTAIVLAQFVAEWINDSWAERGILFQIGGFVGLALFVTLTTYWPLRLHVRRFGTLMACYVVGLAIQEAIGGMTPLSGVVGSVVLAIVSSLPHALAMATILRDNFAPETEEIGVWTKGAGIFEFLRALQASGDLRFAWYILSTHPSWKVLRWYAVHVLGWTVVCLGEWYIFFASRTHNALTAGIAAGYAGLAWGAMHELGLGQRFPLAKWWSWAWWNAFLWGVAGALGYTLFTMPLLAGWPTLAGFVLTAAYLLHRFLRPEITAGFIPFALSLMASSVILAKMSLVASHTDLVNLQVLLTSGSFAGLLVAALTRGLFERAKHGWRRDLTGFPRPIDVVLDAAGTGWVAFLCPYALATVVRMSLNLYAREIYLFPVAYAWTVIILLRRETRMVTLVRGNSGWGPDLAASVVGGLVLALEFALITNGWVALGVFFLFGAGGPLALRAFLLVRMVKPKSTATVAHHRWTLFWESFACCGLGTLAATVFSTATDLENRVVTDANDLAQTANGVLDFVVVGVAFGLFQGLLQMVLLRRSTIYDPRPSLRSELQVETKANHPRRVRL